MTDNEKLISTAPTQIIVTTSPMDALAVMSDQEFDARLANLKRAQDRMAIIQKEIMQERVDYGIIPGTGDKPTLLKPGAEKLCKFHHLVPTFEREMILGDGISRPHIRVLATCSLHYETDEGPILGQGMGAANSWEKKHRYREGQRKCPECGATAIIKGKRFKAEDPEPGFLCWVRKGGCGTKYEVDDNRIVGQQQGRVENEDPFDVENTLVKIAAKRAQTDATLRATATSGLWTQDVEDMAEPEANGHEAPQQPQRQMQRRPQPPKGRPAPADEIGDRIIAERAAEQAQIDAFLTRAEPPERSGTDALCHRCGEIIRDWLNPDGKGKIPAATTILNSERTLGYPHCREHYLEAAKRQAAVHSEWSDKWNEAQEAGLKLQITLPMKPAKENETTLDAQERALGQLKAIVDGLPQPVEQEAIA